MIGIILIIFLAIPESPWWLASKGKVEKASKVLRRCYGGVEGYNIEQQIVRDSHSQAWASFGSLILLIGNHDGNCCS